MTEQMFIYALGRELDYYDDCPLRDATAALEKDEYRLSRMVLGVVQSYPFQHRRNADASE